MAKILPSKIPFTSKHMNQEDFNSLIDATKYQVFICASKMPMPFSFAMHTWIVTIDHGKINRYEVWGYTDLRKPADGHLHINLFQPWVGVRVFPSHHSHIEAKRFSSKILYKLEGEVDSLADHIIKFIENNLDTYPYAKNYHYFPGPNSNTFTQWVINQFPELEYKLPWSAIGKNYKFPTKN